MCLPAGAMRHPFGSSLFGRQLRRVSVSVDHRGDVVRLHPLRHLAGVRLRDPRRRPQRGLAVGRRSLSAGMVERGDHERPVRTACFRHRAPTRTAAFGEGSPLVGPIRSVDRCALDHHRAAPSRGTSLVVGDVAVGQRAVVASEIGDVRAEHDPVRRRAGPEGERGEDLHRRVSFTSCSASVPRAESSA